MCIAALWCCTTARAFLTGQLVLFFGSLLFWLCLPSTSLTFCIYGTIYLLWIFLLLPLPFSGPIRMWVIMYILSFISLTLLVGLCRPVKSFLTITITYYVLFGTLNLIPYSVTLRKRKLLSSRNAFWNAVIYGEQLSVWTVVLCCSWCWCLSCSFHWFSSSFCCVFVTSSQHIQCPTVCVICFILAHRGGLERSAARWAGWFAIQVGRHVKCWRREWNGGALS